MIVRYLTYIGLILVALLLQACPKGVAIQLYNNSKEDLLVLTQNDEQLKWVAGSSLRFGSEAEFHLKLVRDARNFIVPLLSVKKGTKLSNYELSFYGLPDEYVRYSSGSTFTSGTIEYSLQLEEDGNLYPVKPGTPLPATNLVPHPPGFPIKPKSPAGQQ